MEGANPLDAVKSFQKQQRKLELFDVDIYVNNTIVSTMQLKSTDKNQAKIDAARLFEIKVKKSYGTK